MTMCAAVPLLCGLLVGMVHGASKVLPPVTAQGTDVGVVIVAGGAVSHDQYELLGSNIQEASTQRLWVCLIDSNMLAMVSTPNNAEATHIGQCIEALGAGGMQPGAAIMAYEHSLGGVLIVNEVTSFPDLAQGIVLLGATVLSNSAFEGFPVPVLTANGELDGQTRITQHMQAFRHVQENVENGDGSYKLRFPHAVLRGVNHAQYATGVMPDRVRTYWIPSDLDTLQSCQLIASVTLPFVSFLTNSHSGAVNQARTTLEGYYDDTLEYMQPLITAFVAEVNQELDTSPWTTEAQYIIANIQGDARNAVSVTNTEVSRLRLWMASPSVNVPNDAISPTEVETYTWVDHPSQLAADNYEGASMLESKLKSKDAIMEAIGQSDTLGQSVQCSDVNRRAFEWALNVLAPATQKQRFDARDITVDFLDDVAETSARAWFSSDLSFDFDGTRLTIQSSNYITSIRAVFNGGMHYCKLLSPAKALEFIYVDALYDTIYSK